MQRGATLPGNQSKDCMIGTVGCSTSPTLCGMLLNIPEGRGSAVCENPGITLALWTTPIWGVSCRYWFSLRGGREPGKDKIWYLLYQKTGSP